MRTGLKEELNVKENISMVTEIKLRELNNKESKSEKIYTSSSKKVR